MIRAHRGRVIAWDWKHYDYAGLGLVTCASIPALCRALKNGAARLRFLPTYNNTELEFELFLRAAWAVQHADPSIDCLLLVDELQEVVRPGRAPLWWRRIVNLGRVWGFSVAALAARPALVDKDFIGGATYIRSGRLRYEDDARELANVLGVQWRLLQALPDRAAYVNDGRQTVLAS
jgi:hypothetical protein